MAPASLVRKLMNPKKRATQPPAKKKATASTRRKKKKRSPKKKSATKATAATVTTPKKKQTKPTGVEICEYAPTSRAACQGCHKKIQQGQARVGKEEFYPQTQSYIHRFYHVACYQRAFPGVSPKLQSKRSIRDELRHLRQQQAQATRLVQQRAELKQSLEALRKAFAKRLNQRSAFMIFPDATLNDLIVKLPRNKAEMLKVHGIAEQRYKNFGSSILQVLHQYRQQQSNNNRTTATATHRDSNKPRAKATTTTTTKKRKRQRADGDDDDDEDYIPEEAAAAASRPSKRKAATSRNKTSSNKGGKAPQKEIIVIDDTTSSDDEDDNDVFFDAQEEQVESGDDIFDDNDDGGGVMMGKSLSAEEIVQRKFDHAAANNYIISVD